MAANTSLLDFRAGWDGSLSDRLGRNPWQVVGTGITFPAGAIAHFDGSGNGRLVLDNLRFGALRDGERPAICIEFTADAPMAGSQQLFGRDSEWGVQLVSSINTLYMEVHQGGAANFGGVAGIVAGQRHFAYLDYDGAHVRAKLDAADIVVGDAMTGNVKIVTGVLNPSRLVLGSKGDGSNPFKGTIWRVYLWTRHLATLQDTEHESMRTATEPLWLPGRRDDLAPIARRSYYAIYRAAPDDNHQALCTILRVGPGAERFEIDGAAANDQIAGRHGRLSPDDGVTLGPSFPLPDTTVHYGNAGQVEGFYGQAGTIYDWHAGHAVQIRQREYQDGVTQQVCSHLTLRWGDGQNWSPDLEIVYDPGTAPFDPLDPFNANYRGKSEAGPGPGGGAAMCIRPDGKLIIPLANANDPSDPNNATRIWRNGSRVAIGTWTGTTYTFEFSNTISYPWQTHPNGRGLTEPTPCFLPPSTSFPLGRLLVVYRTESGHPMFTHSDDGAATLTATALWTFADGGAIDMASCSPYLFYDPDLGKMFFLGNISFPELIPPDAGNANIPREPLVLGEVDPDTLLLKRETLTDVLYWDGNGGPRFSNIAFLRRFGHRGSYEGVFSLDNADLAHPDRGDCYKLRWQLMQDAIETPNAVLINFAGLVHYFVAQQGNLSWNFETLAWGALPAHSPDRQAYCVGLTQSGGTGSGWFVPPPGTDPVSLVPFQMVGFAPDAADAALDPATYTPPVPVVPTVSVNSYVSPSADDIRNRTGINTHIENLTLDQLNAALLSLLQDAETRTALAVLPADLFDSTTLHPRQVSAFQIAVSYRVGADYLRRVASERVSGTQAPRMMEIAAALREQADALEAEAERYDRLAALIGGEEGTETEPLPFLGVAGVDPNSVSVPPSRRLELLDDRTDQRLLPERGIW